MGSNKTENQLEEAHQRAVYEKAQELIRDHAVMLQALGQEGVAFLNDNQPDQYLEKLAELALADDAEKFGRQVMDQVIQYIWALAEQEVSQLTTSLKH